MTPEEYRDQVNGEPERHPWTGRLTFAFRPGTLRWPDANDIYAQVLDAYESLVNHMMFGMMFTWNEITTPLTPLEEAETFVDELFDDAEGDDE